MAKLPSACKQLFFVLAWKEKKFAEKNKLGQDGSFFYSDKKLAEEMELHPKTIKRHRRRLEKEGCIVTVPGKHEGVATKYWIKERDKLSPSKSSKRGTNFPQVGSKNSLEGGQNVPPNKIQQSENNKSTVFTLEEEIRTLKMMGWNEQKVINHFVGARGIDNPEIREGISKEFRESKYCL